MCGIVGITGNVETREFLLSGLLSLEYRGYDSAGIAIEHDGGMDVVCRVGKVAELARAARETGIDGFCGIGHTRWATHGEPTEANAHPHVDCTGRIAVVHNGIIENHAELRAALEAEGHEFRSSTDTEVIAHLLEKHCAAGADLVEAMRLTIGEIEGQYGIAAIHADQPGIIVVSRKGSPIVVGSSLKGAFVASSASAIIEHTRDVVFLEDDELAVLHDDGHISFSNAAGERVRPRPVHLDWDPEEAGRADFPDYMLKEIHEQPRVIRDVLADRLVDGRIAFPELAGVRDAIERAHSITIVACGTSYHAGLIGRQLIEKWARIPVNVEVASEFRYRDPVIGDRTLVIAITQSGETADTMEAVKQSQEKGSKVIALTNVAGSRAARESDAVLFIKAKLEVSVAATKSFLAQNALLTLLALHLAVARGEMDEAEAAAIASEMEALPAQIERILNHTWDIRRCARVLAAAHSVMYIGRGSGDVTCREGALKLKEISYIHAEAYAAGEIKHGPIALLDENVPVVAIATKSETYDKVISNIVECQSRGAKVVAVATEGDKKIAELTNYVMYIPETPDCFSPITASVPLQLLAREVAVLLGRDVDQPRNLAKSVTVE